MRYKLLIGLVILSLFSSIVFAVDNAPPPIPTEYWGRLMIDGGPAPDGTEIKYFNGDEWIITTTVDGWYSLIMGGGDSVLTYLDDSTCATHWGNEEACIPCSTNPVDEDYCVEGPQKGDDVNLVIDNSNVTVKWGDDISSDETQFSVIGLGIGWNLRSLNLEEKNNSIERLIQGLSGKIVIWYYDETGTWKLYDTSAPFPWLNTLQKMEYGKAYWIKSQVNQNFVFEGTPAGKKTITLEPGWNFVGFNASEMILPGAIDSLTTPIVIWEYNESGDWNLYDTAAPFPWLNTLKTMRETMGYWIKSAIQQVWEI